MKSFLNLLLSLSVLFGCQPKAAADSPAPDTFGGKIAKAAHARIGQTKSYDGSYRSLAYPNGDVPNELGVCTDVVIRALRPNGFDLQKLVHLDMKRSFGSYPKIWGLRRTDRNIDHRRVPNLRTFFKRKGWQLPLKKDPSRFQPGDLVTCTVSGNLPHIMVVSWKKSPSGHPLVVHNIGMGTMATDDLFTYPLTGHYRVKK